MIGGGGIVGTCVAIEHGAGEHGNGPAPFPTAVNPGPLKLFDPSCWPVSKKTPPPPRTTVSRPGVLRSMYAAPSRGAKLNQVVCHSAVPWGASAHVLGLEP